MGQPDIMPLPLPFAFDCAVCPDLSEPTATARIHTRTHNTHSPEPGFQVPALTIERTYPNEAASNACVGHVAAHPSVSLDVRTHAGNAVERGVFGGPANNSAVGHVCTYQMARIYVCVGQLYNLQLCNTTANAEMTNNGCRTLHSTCPTELGAVMYQSEGTLLIGNKTLKRWSHPLPTPPWASAAAKNDMRTV